MEKTNVMRLLDAKGIKYLAKSYDPEVVDGLGVATSLGEDPECVFKSLVTINDKHEHFIFEVPVGEELNLKKAAKASGSKKIEMIKQKELLPLTGYVHGGCSPIGLKKAMPIFMDETAQLFDIVYISAGRRGFQVGINPQDLVSFYGAIFTSLTD